MPSKNTLVKDTPKKGEQTPAKKLLTPDKSAEPPIKKQRTGSPSSDRESETDCKEACPHVGVYEVHLGVKKKTRKMSQVHCVVCNIRFLLVPFRQAVGVTLSGT